MQGDIWEQTRKTISVISSKAWKGIIKYAEKHAVLVIQRRWQLHRGTARISNRMIAEQMQPPLPTLAKTKQKPNTWFKCNHCDFATNGLHGIRSHVSRRHEIRHDATKFLGKTWPEDAQAITHCRACLTDCKTMYRAIVHLKRSNKRLEALRHWVQVSSRGGYMLDTKEKWVRGIRQSMTTEKCMTKICGPKLPTIKEMGCPNPTQLLNVEGNWQNTFPCTDQEKLPYRSCTKEEADEHMTKKQTKRKTRLEDLQRPCPLRNISTSILRKKKAARLRALD